MSAVLDYLPRGNTLSDEEWHRRHRLLQWLLAAHIPGLFLYGVLRGYLPGDVAESLALPLACLIIGHLMRSRRLAATFITLGLVYCSAALVGLSDGAIEAHFHFFIIIGFIALYQDWVPFLLNIVFTVLSHGIGSSFVPDLMFNHASAQEHPWEWSIIHGVAVLAACVGVVLFWKNTEDAQNRSLTLTKQLADAEIGRRRFTSDLLVNLARRNQNLLYRQLDLLNDLEDKERDPDALADLFRLDHLATRIRRNAESLLVLSGEESPRTWREPIPLADVVRAAIAEIEDLDRVDESVDETLAVSGRSVADLTHLFAELLENAVHFSPPGVTVVVRSRPLPAEPGTQIVTIEDWGVGMTPREMAEANDILRRPREVDLSVSQRLGLHVVARLAQRYRIGVELTPTPGGGVTAVATVPASIFERSAELVGAAVGRAGAVEAGRHLDPASREAPAYEASLDRPGRNGFPAANGTPADLRSTPFGTTAAAGRPTLGDPTHGGPDDFRSQPGASQGPDPVSDNGVPRDLRSAAGMGGGGYDVWLGGQPFGEVGPTSGGRPPASLDRPDPAHGRVAGPAVERPGRPTPPLPPDPVDGAVPLPRRDPGEALARNRATEPFRTHAASDAARPADPTRPVQSSETALAARADMDGPARPGSATDRTGTGQMTTPVRAEPVGGMPGNGGQAGGMPGNGGQAGGIPGNGAPAGGIPGNGAPAGGMPGNGGQAGGMPGNGGQAGGMPGNGGQAGGMPGNGGQAGRNGPAGDGDGWSSWWTRVTPPARDESRPDPRPEPEQPNGSAPLAEPRPPADDGAQLRRRVPQANLAAGLRRDNGAQPPHDEAPVVRDPLAARNALSRFQAAQRAARDAVEGEAGEEPR